MASIISYTKARIDTLLQGKASFPTGGVDGQSLVKSGTDTTWGTAGLTAAQIAADPTVRAAFTSREVITPRAGRAVTVLGDSIVSGSGSSNATTTAFVPQLVKLVGGDRMSSAVNAGVAGDRSDQAVSRLPGVLTAGAQMVLLMAGTNDAGANVPLGTYQANMAQAKALCDASGVPLAVALVIPRSAAQSTATVLTRTGQYNHWLRLWAPTVGVALVDTFAAVVDPQTGRLATAFDSGDGVHPNDAGHLAIAKAASDVLRAILPASAWPVVSKGTGGLLSDPLNASTSSWSALAGPQFASQQLVASVGGDLPAGQWQRFTLSNSSSAASTVVGTSIAPGQAVGDKLLFAARIRASTTAALDKLYVVNSSLVAQTNLIESPPSNTPGPVMVVWTSNTTAALSLVIRQTAPANGVTTVDIGAVDVYNLTQLGLNTLPF